MTITFGYVSNLYVELVTMLWECVIISSYFIQVNWLLSNWSYYCAHAHTRTQL